MNVGDFESNIVGSIMKVPGVRDDVCEGAALQELHNDPELILDQEAVVHLDNVRVVVVPHDDHLEMGERWICKY